MKKLLKSNFFKKILQIILALLILIVALVFVCRLLVKSADTFVYFQGTLSDAQKYDYILVPGAGIEGSRPGAHLKDRLDTAISLYKNNAAPKIIVSGSIDKYSKLQESTVMQIYLKNRGVAPEDIICDEYGIDTAETLRRAKAFASSSKILVCTQSLYIERTTYLADRFGLDIDIADSDIRIYTMEVGKSRLRETLAATKAVFEGIFVKSSIYDLTTHPFIIGGTADE